MGIQGARLGRWIVDDAGISFAYARSFAEGRGPVVQAGASPVEGYSDPTWVGLLAIGRLLGLFDHGAWFGFPDYVLFPKALAFVCVVGILICFYAACLAVLTSRRVAAAVTACAGTTLAFVPAFVIWSFSGLENSFYALLVTSLAVLLVRTAMCGPGSDRLLARRTAAIAGLLVALAVLTRPDGLIYLAVYPGVVLLLVDRHRIREVVRPCAFFALAALGPTGVYEVWRRLEFGRWVANTAVAKAQASPVPSDLNRVSEVLQYPGLVISLLAIGVLATAAAVVPEMSRPLVALLVPLALALVGYCVLNADWMGQLRFSTPVWPLAVLATALCTARLVVLPGLRRRIGLVGSLAGALYLAYGVTSPMLPNSAANPTAPLCIVANEDGQLFNEFADIAGVQQGSLLLPDLGGTALTSRLHLRDTAGLSTRRSRIICTSRTWPGCGTTYSTSCSRRSSRRTASGRRRSWPGPASIRACSVTTSRSGRRPRLTPGAAATGCAGRRSRTRRSSRSCGTTLVRPCRLRPASRPARRSATAATG
ncbi:hypothetical protein [Catenulispora sp. GAS73]|uniref:hypothetical protein n=1 Tax=Catenulispora sp. GAS73 TaxID=3156269 RepID=UPI003512139C